MLFNSLRWEFGQHADGKANSNHLSVMALPGGLNSAWVTSSPLTNLGSVFKSGDITLPTKVLIVKAMVFLVVTYGCESWTIKKAECQRIDAFKL